MIELIPLIAAATSSVSASSRIEVVIEGVDSRRGTLVVALYQGEDGWLKPDRAFRVRAIPARPGTQAVVFDDVPRGEYAAAVIHDENGNEKMDMSWFPIPRPAEGAGVSRDATATFGPPSYSDARLSFREARHTLRIRVRY